MSNLSYSKLIQIKRELKLFSLAAQGVLHQRNRACHSHHTRHESHDQHKEAVLYVHWPYCVRRCTYCNFNKYISKNVNDKRMSNCLTKELETLLQLSGVNKIKSIFFGGGTPSLADPSTIADVVDTVKGHVMFAEESEVTLEANPTHLETNKLRDFQSAGVTRLSVGVQALDQDDLKLLGRDHSVEEALRCIESAQQIFPGWVSLDVIFGRPGQTLTQWRTELDRIVDLCDSHVSLYQLTVERGTQLYKWVDSGRVHVPDNELMADLYLAAVETLEANGLNRYEVSNFARQGYESKHNQAYWTGKNYIGIGPGAHGRFYCYDSSGNFQRQARIQTLEPDNWMYEVEKYGHATRKITVQSLGDRLEELLSLCLRTREGITHKGWLSARGEDAAGHASLYDLAAHGRLHHIMEADLLAIDQRGLRATPAGFLVLDTILPYLLLAFNDLQTGKHQSSTIDT